LVLEESIGETGAEEWKSDLHDRLREELNRHRAYSDADWSMPEARLDRLQELVEKLRGEAPEKEAQWLFSDRPNLPVDAHSYRGELQKRRTEALRQIVENDGVEEVVRFARSVEKPAEVGRAYAALDPDEVATKTVLDFLDASGAQGQFAKGFVNTASRDEQWRQDYLDEETLEKWGVAKRVSALLQCPSTEEIFDLVD
jgi:hypothetical protein